MFSLILRSLCQGDGEMFEMEHFHFPNICWYSRAQAGAQTLWQHFLVLNNDCKNMEDLAPLPPILQKWS